MRVPLSGRVPPLEYLPQSTEEPWPELQRFVFIHPGTRWQRKRWEVEKWTALARALLQNHDFLIISTGPDKEEIDLAAQITAVSPKRVYATGGKLSWDANALLLRRADLFVGVDTAMCHLSAASGCPIVALFGPSYEGAWRPWACPHRLVLPPGWKELHEGMGDVSEFLQRRTGDILVEDVLDACLEMARQTP
jgi:heptosyltransferase-3